MEEHQHSGKNSHVHIENLVDLFDDENEDQDDLSFLNKNLPKIPFRLLINGVSGNGKTNLIVNLIAKQYIDTQTGDTVFTKGIHIFSPSVLADKAYHVLTRLHPNWVEDDSALHMYDAIDLVHIANLIDDFTDHQPGLIVIDDSAASDILSSKRFADLFLRSRHTKCCWMITTQMYRLVHKAIRNNCSNLVFYNVLNNHELDLIEHELVTRKTSKEALQKAFSNLSAHSFLHKITASNTWTVGFSSQQVLNQSSSSQASKKRKLNEDE